MTDLGNIIKSGDIALLIKVSYSQSYVFLSSHVLGPYRRLSTKELMLSICDAVEDF